MYDLCTACLCEGRKLHFIGETGSYHLYSQILNEISIYDLSVVCVRVCWECRELLRRFRQFKAQVKDSYRELVTQIQHDPPPTKWSVARPPRLQKHDIFNIAFPDQSIKEEVDDQGVDHKAPKDEPPHSEPEAQAFVEVNEVSELRKKKTTKKTSKEKSKKKLKKKAVEKKINSKKKAEELPPVSSEDERLLPADRSDGDDFPVDIEEDLPIKVKERKLISKIEKTDLVNEDAMEEDIPLSEVKKPPKSNGSLPPRGEGPAEGGVAVGGKTQCPECGKTFSSKKTYRYHLNVLHRGLNRYPCPRCGKVYQWKSNLGRHMRTHKARDSGELYCALCDKRFASVATYRQHLRARDSGELYCALCDKRFASVATYRQHLRARDSGELYCALCDKRFASVATYRQHLRARDSGELYCALCDKRFASVATYRQHLRARDSGELYCALCDKRFASVATYRQHLRVSRRHVSESEFSFVCNECGKKFVSKTRLRDHVDWEHLNNIKFRCQLCNKPFKCHTSLYVHTQNVHCHKKKENLCHICGKSYQNAAKLKYHIVAMHTSETPYRCAHCAAAFGWYSSLYRHVREVHYKMKIQPKKIRKTKRPSEPLPPPPHGLPPAETRTPTLETLRL